MPQSSPRSRTARRARHLRKAFAVGIAGALAVAFTIAGSASAGAATQTDSCVDGSGVRWSAKAMWDGTSSASGESRAIIEYAGWTTSQAGAVATDSWVRSYDGAGNLLRTLAWTGPFDYASGKAYRSRNPVNPPSAPGAAKVTVTLGVDGDGLGNCTISFNQPVTDEKEDEGDVIATDRCDPPRHPRPSCTGTPEGITLKNLGNGDYTVTEPGAVLDGVHIDGSLIVAANDVVIRNSQIDGSLINEVGQSHYSFTVTDTTVGPAQGCITAPGIGESHFTATRVQVRGHDDGFRISGNNVRIEHSYARLCSNAGSHADGIQAYCPVETCTDLVFHHNTVDARNIDATFVINLVDPNLRDVEITDNLLAGGAYTIVTDWSAGPPWTISNNYAVNDAWIYHPVSAENTCSSQVWSGNAIVTINSDYDVISKVTQLPCIN